MAALPNYAQGESALDSIIQRIDEIAVLPHSIFKIMELSGSDSSGVFELEKAIIVDPGFSTRLLTHANTAYYTLPKRVSSIKEAVTYLGFRTIRQMATTVGIFDLFAGKTDKESLRRRLWWRKSIDTAIMCRWIAQETGEVSPDEAYTVGLLHYLGKTILDRSEPGAYDRVEELIEQEVLTLEAETTVFGCNHIQVGMAACRAWGVPECITESLDYATAVDDSHPWKKHVACVAFGHSSATAAIEGLSPQDAPSWTMSLLGLPEEDCIGWIEKSVEYLAKKGSPSMG